MKKPNKFVVAVPSYGNVYNYCYKDLENNQNIELLPGHISFKTKFGKFIYNHHFTKRVKLPFRKMWNNRYYRTKFKKNDNIIFLLSPSLFGIHRYGAIENLRKRYPNCKVVLFLTDLVKKMIINISADETNINKFFKSYDLVFSFDYTDCKKYNLINHPLLYSAPKELEDIEENIDVYFCGRVKDRYKLIIDTFKFLKSKDLRCLFILCDVKKEERLDLDGLVYIDNFIPYEKNIEYIKKSKCLLEIMQGEGSGYTLRTCEAVAYNKKLITNNLKIKEAEFYNNEMMMCFKNIEDIDIDFILSNKIQYENRNYFSPNKMIEKISKLLDE